MALSIIRREIKKIGLFDLSNYYWYFYIIKLDSKPCAKFGKSAVNLENRILQYLNIEHSHQKKDWDTFKLISVVEFEDKDDAAPFESFIKKCFKKYPLNQNQHTNVEQYDLTKVWPKINKTIINRQFPLSSYSFVSDNCESEVKELLKGCKLETTNSISKKIVKRTSKQMTNNDIINKLNGMDFLEFKQINQISDVLAKRLCENKPFSCLSQIMNIKGIATKRYKYIIGYITELLKNSLVVS